MDIDGIPSGLPFPYIIGLKPGGGFMINRTVIGFLLGFIANEIPFSFWQLKSDISTPVYVQFIQSINKWSIIGQGNDRIECISIQVLKQLQ